MSKAILFNFPDEILTPRLVLRPPRFGDGKFLNEAVLESNPELIPYMPWARGVPPTVEDSEVNCRRALAEFILRNAIRIHIWDRKTERFLGACGFPRLNWDLPKVEIGYWIRTSEAGKGYTTEATHALTVFAFKAMKCLRVEIMCNDENKGSKRVPEKLGFQLDGVLRNNDHYVLDPMPRNHLVYSRINTEGLPDLEVSW